MATNNPEIHRSLAVMAIVSVALTAAGFFYSGFCGCLVLAACAALMLTHLAVELFRYRRVEKLSAQLDAGMVTLAREQVPVRELIARAADPLAIAMELREQRLIVQCGAECFTGDPIWSGEALGNILKNCMEHIPEGGSITVTTSETALFTEILVEDTGPGFDEKEIPHLFERFYRGSNAADGSCGIGLALSRTIICAQSGTVQAGNGEHGAKFIIKYYKQVI